MVPLIKTSIPAHPAMQVQCAALIWASFFQTVVQASNGCSRIICDFVTFALSINTGLCEATQWYSTVCTCPAWYSAYESRLLYDFRDSVVYIPGVLIKKV